MKDPSLFGLDSQRSWALLELWKFPSASSSSAGRLRLVAAGRARLGKSFDGALSQQSVCEQTSGVSRHAESVRDDKVQEQDWRQAPARPRDDIISCT